MASQIANIPKEQRCSFCCEICKKLISESTDRYAICGKTNNFTEDLREFNVPFSKDGYLCKSCVRKLDKHRRIKENLEKSAEEIKGLFRTSLKRAVNIVDEDSSISCPVIKKPHVAVDVSTSKHNTNISSTPGFIANRNIFPSIPVPFHTSTPVKKPLEKPSFSKEPTTPNPETIVKVIACYVLLLYSCKFKFIVSFVVTLPEAGLNYRSHSTGQRYRSLCYR